MKATSFEARIEARVVQARECVLEPHADAHIARVLQALPVGLELTSQP